MAATIQGGEWIIKEVKSEDVFIPEEFNEEQLMVRDMCSQFLDTEVLPVIGVDDGAFWAQMQAGVDVVKDIGNGVIKSMVFGVKI